MRHVTLLATAVFALFALTGVAQASEETLALKASESGEILPNFTRAETVIRIEAPEGADKCVMEEPEGHFQKNDTTEIEFHFPKLFERDCEGGATKVRFGSAGIFLLSKELVALAFFEFSSSHVKIRVGLKCRTTSNGWKATSPFRAGQKAQSRGRVSSRKDQNRNAIKRRPLAARRSFSTKERKSPDSSTSCAKLERTDGDI